MRRAILSALLAVAAGTGTAGILWMTGSPWKAALSAAEREAPDPSVAPAARANAPQLPISRVVLFSSGVGYFQRQDEVEGNARVDLSFPVGDINDLLKSMVLQDLGGGHVSAVSYESHDPIDKTLKSFAINLTNDPSLARILQQARGEKIEAVLQQSATTASLPAGCFCISMPTMVPVSVPGAVVADCCSTASIFSPRACCRIWARDGSLVRLMAKLLRVLSMGS